FAFDWVQELQQLTIDERTGASGHIDTVIRVIMVCLFVGGLLAVVIWKVLLRVTREFSDPAVALVLERRFPKELGDRLITAVELSDPKKAESYGFSGPMLAQTVNEAAERVERLPVEQVFDWGRLKRLWYGALLVTVG